jgi:hypothetical protein
VITLLTYQKRDHIGLFKPNHDECEIDIIACSRLLSPTNGVDGRPSCVLDGPPEPNLISKTQEVFP